MQKIKGAAVAERLERATPDRAFTHGLDRRAFESCNPLGFSVEIESLGRRKENVPRHWDI